MSFSHSEENPLIETQEDATGGCLFSLSTPLSHNTTTFHYFRKMLTFWKDLGRTIQPLQPSPPARGAVLYLRVRGTAAACSLQWGQWVARLTALPDRRTWSSLVFSWHCFHAGIYLDSFHFPAAERLSPTKARELMSLQSTVSSSRKKLNSTSGHINTPRQISVNSLVALMCHLLL